MSDLLDMIEEREEDRLQYKLEKEGLCRISIKRRDELLKIEKLYKKYIKELNDKVKNDKS